MSTVSSTARVDQPLRLEPILVAKPWGGRRLAAFGRTLPPDLPIGESWDVVDLDPSGTTATTSPSSVVAAGPHAGRTLGELLTLDPHGLLGPHAARHARFPLLVKLLDASTTLSIQVHPTAGHAARHPGAAIKTESWVVLHAEPDAHLYLGVRPGVRFAELAAAAGTNALVGLLRTVPARAGDAIHLPGGLVHALGAGTVVAEVQTPSDTTYRLYDWAEELDRPSRELHLEAGLACIEEAWEVNLAPPAPVRATEGVLVETATYRIAHRVLDAEGLRVDPGTLRIIHVVDGELTTAAADDADDTDGTRTRGHPLRRGEVLLLPAAWHGTLHPRGRGATVLETSLLA